MTDEFAIKILEQYREKPTLINEIETVEEAVWLDEALAMGIKALKQEPILDKIRAEIEAKCCITVGRENDGAITLHDVFEIIDKYKAESAHDVAQEIVKNRVVDL